ncbi:MAG: hypothetical protein K2L07_04905 [Lachnospiraceae bacterium]|nr:hypothetical protein [Lachnospiraceae bacterium]
MMTYEMVGVADQNGRTYESIYGTYNKQTGFKIDPKYIRYSTDLGSKHILFSYQRLINGLFHDNCWSLKVEKPKPKKMTKEEIEKALGYEIEIQDKSDSYDSQTLEKNSRDLYDFFDFFWD